MTLSSDRSPGDCAVGRLETSADVPSGFANDLHSPLDGQSKLFIPGKLVEASICDQAAHRVGVSKHVPDIGQVISFRLTRHTTPAANSVSAAAETDSALLRFPPNQPLGRRRELTDHPESRASPNTTSRLLARTSPAHPHHSAVRNHRAAPSRTATVPRFSTAGRTPRSSPPGCRYEALSFRGSRRTPQSRSLTSTGSSRRAGRFRAAKDSSSGSRTHPRTAPSQGRGRATPRRTSPTHGRLP